MNQSLPTRRALGSAAFLFMLTCVGLADALAEGPRQVREFRGRTMGTTYMVKVAGADDVSDDDIRFAIDAELRDVNDQMSTYLESSEISQFNQSTSTDWFAVSADFAMVVDFAQKLSAKTDGAFDVTVGPLVNLWSFGAEKTKRQVPTDSAIASVRDKIGFQRLDVRLEPPALRKSVPDLQIDLSSIAKGHGVDRVIDRLAEIQVQDAFVEIGGEVRTVGDKPGGPWRVGIQLPDARNDQVMVAHRMVWNDVAGNAMATSGDYRNFFVVDGKRYSHTINPKTGAPVDHSLASVTVVANHCMDADAWATALNVLGTSAGQRIATDNNLHTLLVSRDGDGGYQMVGTGILAQYAQQNAADAEPAFNWFAAVIPVAIMTFGVFSILLFAMAIGVLFGRKSIAGSCGGLASKTNEDGTTSCSLCNSPSEACKELREKMAESNSSA